MDFYLRGVSVNHRNLGGEKKKAKGDARLDRISRITWRWNIAKNNGHAVGMEFQPTREVMEVVRKLLGGKEKKRGVKNQEGDHPERGLGDLREGKVWGGGDWESRREIKLIYRAWFRTQLKGRKRTARRSG